MKDKNILTLPDSDHDVSEIARTQTPWTWRDRIRCKLFPPIHCDWPDPTRVHKDGLCCRVTVDLSLINRLRVLVTGRVCVESRTITEHIIGDNKTNSTFTALPPKWMERP